MGGREGVRGGRERGSGVGEREGVGGGRETDRWGEGGRKKLRERERPWC